MPHKDFTKCGRMGVESVRKRCIQTCCMTRCKVKAQPRPESVQNCRMKASGQGVTGLCMNVHQTHVETRCMKVAGRPVETRCMKVAGRTVETRCMKVARPSHQESISTTHVETNLSSSQTPMASMPSGRRCTGEA